MDFLERVEEQIRRHDLIPAGGEVTCLVSGGADSGALWHSLRELGHEVELGAGVAAAQRVLEAGVPAGASA